MHPKDSGECKKSVWVSHSVIRKNCPDGGFGGHKVVLLIKGENSERPEGLILSPVWGVSKSRTGKGTEKDN